MSMKVDFSTPLTEEERAYLEGRGSYADIQRADSMHGTDSPDLGEGDGSGPLQQPLVTSEARAVEKERLLARLKQIEADETGNDSDDDADGEVDPYEVWTAPELKSEIDRRNAGREVKISKGGTKEELAQRLYADDAAEAGETQEPTA